MAKKCRGAVRFNTTRIVKGEVIREAALIRCDLRELHEGNHWLALVEPWRPKMKREPRQLGYLFWQAEKRQASEKKQS